HSGKVAFGNRPGRFLSDCSIDAAHGSYFAAPGRILGALIAERRVFGWRPLFRKLSGIWSSVLSGSRLVDAVLGAVGFCPVCCRGECIGSDRRPGLRSSLATAEKGSS